MLLLLFMFLSLLLILYVSPSLISVDHDDHFTGKYFFDMAVNQFSAHLAGALLILCSANFLISHVLLNDLLYKVQARQFYLTNP